MRGRGGSSGPSAGSRRRTQVPAEPAGTESGKCRALASVGLRNAPAERTGAPPSPRLLIGRCFKCVGVALWCSAFCTGTVSRA